MGAIARLLLSAASLACVALALSRHASSAPAPDSQPARQALLGSWCPALGQPASPRKIHSLGRPRPESTQAELFLNICYNEIALTRAPRPRAACAAGWLWREKRGSDGGGVGSHTHTRACAHCSLPHAHASKRVTIANARQEPSPQHDDRHSAPALRSIDAGDHVVASRKRRGRGGGASQAAAGGSSAAPEGASNVRSRRVAVSRGARKSARAAQAEAMAAELAAFRSAPGGRDRCSVA